MKWFLKIKLHKFFLYPLQRDTQNGKITIK